jgi:ketosteroid isomerase-like protein
MSEGNVEAVRSMVDALDREDVNEAFAYLASDVEFHTTGRFADKGVYRGHAGIEGLLAEWREDIEGAGTEILDIRAVGEDQVFLAAVLTGRGKRSRATYRERLWYLMRFSNDLVVRVDTYVDEAEALEAAGLRE